MVSVTDWDPSMTSARMIMERAGLEVIWPGPYCSGLSGGAFGKLLKLAGRIIWIISAHRVTFAPSVFVIGRPVRRFESDLIEAWVSLTNKSR